MQPPNPAVLQVDVSYCNQVGVHNVEFFLQEVLLRPNLKLKQLTVGSRSYGFSYHVRSCCCFCSSSMFYDTLHMPNKPLAILCTWGICRNSLSIWQLLTLIMHDHNSNGRCMNCIPSHESVSETCADTHKSWTVTGCWDSLHAIGVSRDKIVVVKA